MLWNLLDRWEVRYLLFTVLESCQLKKFLCQRSPRLSSEPVSAGPVPQAHSVPSPSKPLGHLA